jgi:hypothetical protein
VRHQNYSHMSTEPRSGIAQRAKLVLQIRSDKSWVFVGTFGEILFMIWLLVMGWRIQEPAGNNRS